MYVLFAPSALAFVLIAITQIVSEMRAPPSATSSVSSLKHPPLRAQGGCPLGKTALNRQSNPSTLKGQLQCKSALNFQCSCQDMVAYEVIGHADIFSVETYRNFHIVSVTCAQH